MAGASIGILAFAEMWFTQCHRFHLLAKSDYDSGLKYWLMMSFGLPLLIVACVIDTYFGLVIYSFVNLPEGKSSYPNYESVYDDPEIASLENPQLNDQ